MEVHSGGLSSTNPLPSHKLAAPSVILRPIFFIIILKHNALLSSLPLSFPFSNHAVRKMVHNLLNLVAEYLTEQPQVQRI